MSMIMRRCFSRNLTSQVRFLHYSRIRYNEVINKPVITINNRHNNHNNHNSHSHNHNEIQSKDILIRRIKETGGNLKLDELFKLSKSSLKEGIPLSTFNQLSEAHLRNLLIQLDSKMLIKQDIQSYMIMEFNSLVRNHRSCFKKCLLILCESNESIKLLLMDEVNKLPRFPHSKECFNLLIKYTLYYKNTILLGSLIINNSLKLFDQETIKLVIKSLLFKNPLLEEYQLSLIMKISNYTNYKFDEFESNQILSKLENIDNVSLIKKFQVYLLYNTRFNSQRSKIKHYYKLIQSDAKLKNFAGCYLNWREIMNLYDSIEKHDIRIIALLLETFNKSPKYLNVSKEIISKLPKNYYSNSLILDELLTFAYKSKNIELINEISNEIKFTTRSTLTILLRLNMIFNNLETVKVIIKEIIDRSGYLSAFDNEIIVKGFLKNGKHKQALEFLGNLPPIRANSSYLTYIDMMINCSTKLTENQLLIIDKFVENMKTINIERNSFWIIFGSLYFKHIAKNAKTTDELVLLKKIYENSSKNYLQLAFMEQSNSTVLSNTITFNPFRVPNNERNQIIIKVSNQSKIILVQTILDKAIKLKSYSLLDWTCRELLDLGLTVSDIEITVNKKFHSNLTKVGLEERKSIELFKQNWKDNTLNIIKKQKVFKSDDGKNKDNHNSQIIKDKNKKIELEHKEKIK